MRVGKVPREMCLVARKNDYILWICNPELGERFCTWPFSPSKISSSRQAAPIQNQSTLMIASPDPQFRYYPTPTKWSWIRFVIRTRCMFLFELTSRNSWARSIISKVEFQRVFTSSTNSLVGRLAASHWQENFSQHCGNARILTTSLRSCMKWCKQLKFER